MGRLAAVLLVLGLALSGCATKDAATPKPAPTPTPAATSAQQQGPKKSLVSQILGGFGLWEKVFPKKKGVPKALPAHMIGTIKLVNKDDQFVLIDTISFSNSPPGTSLLCIMDEKQTATLKLSGLRNPPFLIADIVAGTPSPGDRVYQP